MGYFQVPQISQIYTDIRNQEIFIYKRKGSIPNQWN